MHIRHYQWPWLARLSVPLILPAALSIPIALSCGRDWSDCLIQILIDFRELATWLNYSLLLLGFIFQCGLWRYVNKPRAETELGEFGWSVGFYFAVVLIMYITIVVFARGD